MSKDLNKVQLIGRLGADPELSYSDEGTARCTFRVAVNRQWKDAAGDMRQETDWFGIVAWQRLAEICGEYLHTGSRIYLEGRLKTMSWEDEQGTRQYRTEIALNDLIMLDAPPRRDDQAKANDGANIDDAGYPPDAPTVAPEPALTPSPQPTRRRKKMSKAELDAASADLL